jgi:hypothetical protein
MKKNINLLIIFFLILMCGVGTLPSSFVYAHDESPAHQCTSATAFDPVSGVSCALIPSCSNGEEKDFRTGKLCPGVTSNSSSGDITVSNAFIDYLSGSLKSSTLKYGKKASAEVELLQIFLIEEGLLDSSLATGNFFAKTKAALLAYQIKNGLTRDGMFGRQTYKAMMDAIARDPGLLAKMSSRKRIYVATKSDLSEKEKIANFVAAAERTINLADPSTLGVKVLDVPGTVNYQKNFGVVPGVSQKGEFIIYTHFHTY